MKLTQLCSVSGVLSLAVASLLPIMVAGMPTHAPPSFVPGTFAYNNGDNPIAPLQADPTVKTVPDSYMVILKPEVSEAEFLAHRERISGAQVAASNFLRAQGSDVDASSHGLRHVYDLESHLQGYSGLFTPDVLSYIRVQPEVDYVEVDSVVNAEMLPQGDEHVWNVPKDMSFSEVKQPTPQTFPWPGEHEHYTEKGAPWGLARISHRPQLRLGTFNKYVYEADAGEGVIAYVIDTGINVKHEDFGGRAKWGKTIPAAEEDNDGHGHGTHCAGTIGSSTFGVAKKAEIIAVKVLGAGGSGSMSDVTAGVLWAAADAKSRTEDLSANMDSKEARRHKGFVANMSLGGGKSPTLDRAVDGAVASGLHFAVAAGNEDQDACDASPAGAKNPVTVGASTIRDERAYFSNKGKCVDIFAPGLNILSTWNSGSRSVNTISGTSMATPHIVGLMAYLLSIYGTEDFGIIEDAKAARFGPYADSVEHRLNAAPMLYTARYMLYRFLETVDYLWFSVASWGPYYMTEDLTERIFAPPIPFNVIESVLDPSDLKKAMSRLATSGILSDVDHDTTNKLAFNNATRSL